MLVNIWSGIRESNPRLKLGKLAYYHCTNPAEVYSENTDGMADNKDLELLACRLKQQGYAEKPACAFVHTELACQPKRSELVEVMPDYASGLRPAAYASRRLERDTGIEPASLAWEASVLPLY